MSDAGWYWYAIREVSSLPEGGLLLLLWWLMKIYKRMKFYNKFIGNLRTHAQNVTQVTLHMKIVCLLWHLCRMLSSDRNNRRKNYSLNSIRRLIQNVFFCHCTCCWFASFDILRASLFIPQDTSSKCAHNSHSYEQKETQCVCEKSHEMQRIPWNTHIPRVTMLKTRLVCVRVWVCVSGLLDNEHQNSS